jgi:hypothetical protein
MTDLPDGTAQLERRAVAMRSSLLDTIDALERRGERLVATVNDARRIFALVADAAAVLGAVSTMVALVRSHRRSVPRRYPVRERPHLLRHVALFGVLAGVAYVARRAARPTPHRAPMHTPRLRAMS